MKKYLPTLTAITMGCLGALVWTAITRHEYARGYTDGIADNSEVWSDIGKLGFCEWPAAFYRQANCPGTMIYTPLIPIPEGKIDGRD